MRLRAVAQGAEPPTRPRGQDRLVRRRFLGVVGASGAVAAISRSPAAAAATKTEQPLSDHDSANATLLRADDSATRSELTSNGELPVGKHELVVNVKDFGAAGDGSTNDTAAIQSAIDYTRSRPFPGNGGPAGGVVYLPGGEYVLDSTLNLHLFSGTLRGNGLGNAPTYRSAPGQATVLRWAGGAAPMIRVQDSRHVVMENLRLAGGIGTAPTHGINLHNLSTDRQGRNGSLHIRDVVIGEWPWEGTPSTRHPVIGIGWSGDDGNNDAWTVERVVIRGCAIGIDLPNLQSIWGQVRDTAVSKAATVGLRTRACVIASNVNFQHCAVDVQLLAAAQFDVHGLNSEHSGQVCHVAEKGRLQVRGGLWTLTSPMGSNPFIQHDGAAFNNAGVALDGVYIVNSTRGQHPTLRMTANGSSAAPGHLTLRDLRTTMALSDIDLRVSGGSKLFVNIASTGWSIQGATLLSDATGDTIPQQLTGPDDPQKRVAAPVGSTYQRMGGGSGPRFYVKQSGAGGKNGWVAK
ncbi:MAG: glycosyl hydrolase family 28-related protein [Euzebya sp.]